MLNVRTAASGREPLQALPFQEPFPILNPQADPSLETQTICTLTQLCTVGDGHPSDAGYLVLANVVFEVSEDSPSIVYRAFRLLPTMITMSYQPRRRGFR